MTFVGANSYIVKNFADPDTVSHCVVHACNATASNWVSGTIIAHPTNLLI